MLNIQPYIEEPFLGEEESNYSAINFVNGGNFN